MNGPYLVAGTVPISLQVITPNREVFSWEWKQERSFEVKSNYRLCRCGHSKNKRFCDDSHLNIPFDGTETATRQQYEKQAERYDGPSLILKDAVNFCAFARFCDPGGKIWAVIRASDNPESRELAIREATHCPSGRLVLLDKRNNKQIEPHQPASIGVVEDSALKCSGPLWVRGAVPIESSDGTTYESRERVTLCRCGASSNKPFCDKSHEGINFRHDGLLGENEARVDEISPKAGSVKIIPSKNGPFRVRGPFELRGCDQTCYSGNKVTLCRCGASANKPFCDDSHLRIGFKSDG